MTKVKEIALKPQRLALLLLFVSALFVLMIVFNLMTGDKETEGAEQYSASPEEAVFIASDEAEVEDLTESEPEVDEAKEAEEIVEKDAELEDKKVEAYEISKKFATLLFDTDGEEPTNKAENMNKYSAESLQAVTNDDLQTYRPTAEHFDRKAEEVKAEATEYDEDMDVLYVDVEVNGFFYSEDGKEKTETSENYTILFSYEDEVEVVEYLVVYDSSAPSASE